MRILVIFCFIVFLCLSEVCLCENGGEEKSTKNGGSATPVCKYIFSFDGPIVTGNEYALDTTLISDLWISITQPKKIAEYLNVQPGMIIADIGAGGGIFTFAFADAMKGTGKVFATDVKSYVTAPLNRRAEIEGYNNVTAVLVGENGVDPFYKKHVFDLIFCSNVYPDIIDPQSYFAALKSSLKKETGRLVIVEFKNDPDFTAYEFGDFIKFFEVLTSKREKYPVFRRLSPQAQSFVMNWRGEPVPDDIKQKIIGDLNKMLNDRFLFKELNDFYLPSCKLSGGKEEIYTPQDDLLVNWLVAFLDETGAFEKDQKTIPPLVEKNLRRLNRILLMSIFKTREWYELSRIYGYFRLNKMSIIRTLQKAGYELMSDDDKILNYFHVLQFRRVK